MKVLGPRGCGIVVVLSTFGLLAACAPHERNADWEQHVKAKARVISIDHDARRIELRIGVQRITLKVAPSVKSFDARKVGDVIGLTYYEAILVALAPEDGTKAEDLTKYRLSPATPARPAVAFVKAHQFTAEFLDYDYQSNIASFQMADGSYPVLIVPLRLRPFMRTLLPGDRLSVSMEQAIAVTLSPVPVPVPDA